MKVVVAIADIGFVFELVLKYADPLSYALFLSKVLELISVRLALSTYIAPPFLAELFVKFHEVQVKEDYVVTSTAPPFSFASF